MPARCRGEDAGSEGRVIVSPNSSWKAGPSAPNSFSGVKLRSTCRFPGNRNTR